MVTLFEALILSFLPWACLFQRWYKPMTPHERKGSVVWRVTEGIQTASSPAVTSSYHTHMTHKWQTECQECSDYECNVTLTFLMLYLCFISNKTGTGIYIDVIFFKSIMTFLRKHCPFSILGAKWVSWVFLSGSVSQLNCFIKPYIYIYMLNFHLFILFSYAFYFNCPFVYLDF